MLIPTAEAAGVPGAATVITTVPGAEVPPGLVAVYVKVSVPF